MNSKISTSISNDQEEALVDECKQLLNTLTTLSQHDPQLNDKCLTAIEPFKRKISSVKKPKAKIVLEILHKAILSESTIEKLFIALMQVEEIFKEIIDQPTLCIEYAVTNKNASYLHALLLTEVLKIIKKDTEKTIDLLLVLVNSMTVHSLPLMKLLVDFFLKEEDKKLLHTYQTTLCTRVKWDILLNSIHQDVQALISFIEFLKGLQKNNESISIWLTDTQLIRNKLLTHSIVEKIDKVL